MVLVHLSSVDRIDQTRHLLDLESATMLTAIGMALMLGLPQPGCSGQGGNCFPPGACQQGGTTGFSPLGSCQKCFSRVCNVFKGDIWGFSASKCACPLGSYAPGGDNWAYQMHGGVMMTAPVSVPVATPAPAPAPTRSATPRADPPADLAPPVDVPDNSAMPGG